MTNIEARERINQMGDYEWEIFCSSFLADVNTDVFDNQPDSVWQKEEEDYYINEWRHK